MNIREAKIQDVGTIHSLISYYAELERMLFRQKADIYENIQSFVVAELDGNIVGCCMLQVIWSDLAEIRSLAVSKDAAGTGIGKALVQYCVEKTRNLGVSRVFALTLEPKFFEKLDFKPIDKQQLPMKVWSDCANCSKQDHCDEFAYILEL